MNSPEDFIYAYPEQFSKDCLIKRLIEFGCNEVHKIDDDFHKLVQCFYDNLASLPRRPPRDNRRGKLMRKIQMKEDRDASSRVVDSSVCSLLSYKNRNPVRESNSDISSLKKSSVDSMSEMAKLEARSRAVKQRSRDIEPVVKRAKLADKVTKTLPPQTINSSPATSPAKLVSLTDCKNGDRPSCNRATKVLKDDDHNGKRLVTMIKDAVKAPRKKLKRDRHLPNTQCTINSS